MKIRNIITLYFTLLTTASFGQKAHFYPPELAKWDADQLGNQRAVVQVLQKGNSITVNLPWRNRNVLADQQIIVVDSSSNKQYSPLQYGKLSEESGVIQFETSSGPGIYYVYYLPYKLGGRSKNYPDAIYLKNNQVVNQDLKPENEAFKILRFESVDKFNSNDEMDLIASQSEKADFLRKNNQKAYLLFPENISHQIKSSKYFPKRWTSQNIEGNMLKGTTDKGVLFPFQIGIYSDKQDLNRIKISFQPESGDSNKAINASAFTCFNTEGTSYAGKPLKFDLSVKKEVIQAIWCGIEVPENLAAGVYNGKIRIEVSNAETREIPIQLQVNDQVATNKGYDEPWKLTRLNWLNSTLAQENTVISPYLPLKLLGKSSIEILGRQVELQDNGLPAQIKTFFAEDMISMQDKGNNILNKALAFRVIDKSGKDVAFKSKGLSFDKKEEGLYSWHAVNESDKLQVVIAGSLEFDGFMDYQVQLIAKENMDLSDVRLELPLNPSFSKYFMGLGEIGGFRKDKIDWKWDVKNKNQDGAWIGSVNAGIQFSLRDEKYSRPLNTNFYLQKPLILPNSWGNSDKGGIKIQDDKGTTLVNNYSGSRSLAKGDTLYFNFHLMITPFHTINTDWQWNNRFFHAYKPIEQVKNSGANVINLHHGSLVNPYINYPFVATKEMKTYIDLAHQAGLKVKIYNTVREVSNRLYELYPLRSLGHEVFSPGKGAGYSWLQEHINEDYIAAWYVPEFKDAAIINSGMNRWHNYYVEGMNWLVDHVGIDGIYLDDVAFDRITMKRIKRVMTKNGHPGIIDLHSANQFNKSDGFNNSANLYMEHFPYLNKLWFGEYFDYENNGPDFFMTEVSGIPFGLMGEMLQDGGNPWRGMVYGMTNRYPWEGAKDTRDIWRIWDEFGIKDSKMLGYWVESNPVKSKQADILVTSYVNKGKTMLAVASWAKDNSAVDLQIDWKKLGLDPKKVKIHAPAIKNVQEAQNFKVGEAIPVEKNKGWILLIES